MCLVYHFVLYAIKEKHKVITNYHNGDVMISINNDGNIGAFTILVMKMTEIIVTNVWHY